MRAWSRPPPPHAEVRAQRASKDAMHPHPVTPGPDPGGPCTPQPDRPRQAFQIAQPEVQAFAIEMTPTHQCQGRCGIGQQQNQLPDLQLSTLVGVAQQARAARPLRANGRHGARRLTRILAGLLLGQCADWSAPRGAAQAGFDTD